MVTLNPTPLGYDLEEDLLRKAADALGFDLSEIEAGEEEIETKCPCCQLDAVVELLKAERENCYRKGWQRIVDGETPSCPDLIFGTEMEASDLLPPQP